MCYTVLCNVRYYTFNLVGHLILPEQLPLHSVVTNLPDSVKNTNQSINQSINQSMCIQIIIIIYYYYFYLHYCYCDIINIHVLFKLILAQE